MRLKYIEEKELDEIKSEIIFTLGKKNALESCIQLVAELNKYEKATGNNMQHLIDVANQLSDKVTDTVISKEVNEND